LGCGYDEQMNLMEKHLKLVKDFTGDVDPTALDLFSIQFDLVEFITYEIESLKAKNAELEKNLTELNKKIEQYAVREEFVKYRGVLLKKELGRTYVKGCYCPVCRTALVEDKCSVLRCPGGGDGHGVFTEFSGLDIQKTIDEFIEDEKEFGPLL